MVAVNKRAVLKTFTWRIISTLATFIIILITTNNIALAGTLGIADTIVKTGLFYAHEHFWSKSTYGR